MSLTPVSLLSLAISLGVVVIGPPLAHWFARHPQPPQAAVTLVLLENSAVLAGGVAVACAADLSSRGAALATSPAFLLGLAFVSVDAAVTSVMSLLLEKDVIGRVFAASVGPATTAAVPLEQANAAITRADLVASIGVYLVLGYATRDVNGGIGAGEGSGSGQPMRSTLACLAAWHVIAGTMVLTLLGRLRQAAPDALPDAPPAVVSRPPATNTRDAATPPVPLVSPPVAPPLTFTQLLLSGPRTVGALPRAPRLLMCAFVSVFFTVLSPSSLLTACLRSRGVSAQGRRALALMRTCPSPSPSHAPAPSPSPALSPSHQPHIFATPPASSYARVCVSPPSMYSPPSLPARPRLLSGRRSTQRRTGERTCPSAHRAPGAAGSRSPLPARPVGVRRRRHVWPRLPTCLLAIAVA